MKRQGLTKHQQKSQSASHPSSGWLQRAAVRSVPEKQVNSGLNRASGLNRSFVNVPVAGNRLPVVQPKLAIGEPDHTYEQAADTWQRTPQPQVQLQQNTDTESRKPSRGDRIIQGKGELTGNSQVSSEVQRPNKTGLPDRLKTGIENLSGYSMDDVRVHYNSSKPAQLQAHAYTQGTDIHLASGQEKHLPHEGWHVVQQMQGRVKATMQAKGVAVNNDPALEREADLMGAKALQKSPVRPRSNQAIADVSLLAQRSGETNQLDLNRISPIPVSRHHNKEVTEREHPVQRMVYDSTTNKLYVSNNWKNIENAEGTKVKEALEVESTTKFKSKKIANLISNAYDIEGHNTTIIDNNTNDLENTSNYNNFVQENYCKLFIPIEEIVKEYNTKNNTDNELEKEIKVEKIQENFNENNAVDIEKMLKILSKKIPDQNQYLIEYVQNSFKKRFAEGLTKMVNQDHYLLNLNDMMVNDTFLKSYKFKQPFESMISFAKAVLLPQDYLDKDDESEVNFDLAQGKIPQDKQTKVCVLISMVYQKAASARDKQSALEQVQKLLGKFDININSKNFTQKNDDSGLPKNELLYDDILAKLHEKLRQDKIYYDLDRVNEKVLAEAGYKRIVSCLCKYENLPANIPPHITLNKGTSYIFYIKGHAMAVVVKENIEGQLGEDNPKILDKHSNYFNALNETKYNYNGEPWKENITAIWQEES
ncbi:DUF4157 domain-containing protein [Moorena sp. SIO4G3]|uniref:eCIS core domain-containing protein n=1 Tax=Moorena sp. SIO4G3 TaxID=2607821 RepID=UPI00142C1613|nr:DUF4157 domain-containing protein [Moorena sp. SIO4G3]NEO77711.1 DUF4157 domain-containing protein [Moorena sp. SIO4G3]